jgi:hypothetical protein
MYRMPWLALFLLVPIYERSTNLGRAEDWLREAI